MGKLADRIWNALDIMANDADETDEKISSETDLDIADVLDLRDLLDQYAYQTVKPSRHSCELEALSRRVADLEVQWKNEWAARVALGQAEHRCDNPACPICRFGTGYMSSGSMDPC